MNNLNTRKGRTRSTMGPGCVCRPWVLALVLPLTMNAAAHAAEIWTEDASGCKHFNARPSPDESVSWTGACADGLADGEGVLEWRVKGKVSSRYTGLLKRGRMSGHGTYRWSHGEAFEGDYVEGRKTGRGIYRWPNGAVYEGDWVDGEWHGHGTYRWANGDTYEGDFVNGKMTGHGVMRSPDGHTYEGAFVNAKPNGHGVARLATGQSFEADFVDGEPTGSALIRLADGQTTAVDFVNGKPVVRSTAPGSAERPREAASICPKTQAPEPPEVAGWKGVAIFKAIVTVRSGRITEVVVKEMNSLTDEAVRDAFVRAISTTIQQGYECVGDHVFERVFQFQMD